MRFGKTLRAIPGWSALAGANALVAVGLTCLQAFSISTEPYSYFGALLVFAPMFVLFLALAVWSVVYIFVGWRKHRLRALLPVIAWAIAFMAFWRVSQVRSDQVFRGTPLRPESYFAAERQTAFEAVAKRLLDRNLKRIWFPPEGPVGIEWVSGYAKGDIEADILSFLREQEFRSVSVDDRLRIVTFGYYLPRTWYSYIYSENELKPPLEMSPEITETDIGNLTQVIQIAQQGPTASGLDRKKFRFEPTIVYSHLESALGSEFMDRVRSYRSQDDFDADERAAILAALNQHRRFESRLVEHPSICYGRWQWHGENRHGLNIAHAYGISDGFWVVSLMKQLLKEGILTATGDEGRLTINPDIGSADQRKVEWLNVGLMNFVYGNLVDKRQHPYDRQISDNWYFCAD